MEDEMIPFPREEVTPPVTKMNLVFDMVNSSVIQTGKNTGII
jgi:hypothetical protein